MIVPRLTNVLIALAIYVVGTTVVYWSWQSDPLITAKPVAEILSIEGVERPHATPDGRSLLGLDGQAMQIIKSYEPIIQKLPRIVALTFDDGPHRLYTEQALQILKKHQIPATFFLIGNQVERYPDIVRQIAADQHEIGNHTWDHTMAHWHSPEKIADQMQRTETAIWEAAGIRPTIFRPPFGLVSKNLKQTSQWPLILWSVDTKDWQLKNPRLIAERATNQVHPGGIILLHDIYPESIAALDTIITKLKGEGYQFVTVSTLFGFDKQPDLAVPGQIYYFNDFVSLGDGAAGS